MKKIIIFIFAMLFIFNLFPEKRDLKVYTASFKKPDKIVPARIPVAGLDSIRGVLAFTNYNNEVDKLSIFITEKNGNIHRLLEVNVTPDLKIKNFIAKSMSLENFNELVCYVNAKDKTEAAAAREAELTIEYFIPYCEAVISAQKGEIAPPAVFGYSEIRHCDLIYIYQNEGLARTITITAYDKTIDREIEVMHVTYTEIIAIRYFIDSLFQVTRLAENKNFFPSDIKIYINQADKNRENLKVKIISRINTEEEMASAPAHYNPVNSASNPVVRNSAEAKFPVLKIFFYILLIFGVYLVYILYISGKRKQKNQ